MKFEVNVYRQVQDSLRTTVEVEADTEAGALEKAQEIVCNDCTVWDFHACGDSVGDDEFEVTPL